MKQLIHYDFFVHESFVASIFKQWHWIQKRPTHQQIQKYSITNIQWYWQHITGILTVPYKKLKYLDEAHFVSKDLHAQYALSEKEEHSIIYTSAKLDSSYSLTLMTTLADPDQTCVVDLRYKSNTQWDFLHFIEFVIEKNYLVRGDVLVVKSLLFLTDFYSWIMQQFM